MWVNSWFQFVVICTPSFFLHSSVAFDSLLLEWNQDTVWNMDKLSISELCEVIKQNQKRSHSVSIWKHELAELDAQTLQAFPKVSPGY